MKISISKQKITVLKIIKGEKPGRTSIIMAGTHGNETCGINAFQNILPNLSIERGKVIFVIGNPKAVKKNIRFTEFNLNRAFLPSSKYSNKIKKTYEYNRAQELKKFLDQGDALLDIHSTLNPGEPFIICEKNSFEIVNCFPKEFKRIVSGFDKLEPGATENYMISRAGIGIGIECGQHDNPRSIEIAKNAIISFLSVRNHIDHLKHKIIKKREVIQMNYIYHTETNSFVLARKFFDFEKIKKGEVIGIDGNKKKKAPRDCVVVFAHDRNKKNEEAYLLGNTVG